MEDQQPLFELTIDPASHASLMQTAKWAKFLSIVGFVFIGLMVVLAFFVGALMSTFGSAFGAGAAALPGALLTVIYLAGAALWFVPNLLLLQFANRAKTALDSNDQELLSRAFASQRTLFKFIGILTIICLAFYGLLFVIAALGALARR